jgi:hypothetical protein
MSASVHTAGQCILALTVWTGGCDSDRRVFPPPSQLPGLGREGGVGGVTQGVGSLAFRG